ncbi:50S ribosomal protein L33, partial [Dysosmobacter welbionis]
RRGRPALPPAGYGADPEDPRAGGEGRTPGRPVGAAGAGVLPVPAEGGRRENRSGGGRDMIFAL